MALIYSKFMAALGCKNPSKLSISASPGEHSIRKVVEWLPDGIEPWPSATNGQQTKGTVNSTGARGQCAQVDTVTAVGLFLKTYTEEQIIYLSGCSLGAIADRVHQ